jgi:DNA-directed RNA polymerase specialized sigma24 family protein
MDLIMRFLDPNDPTVRWASDLGTPTTDGIYALLKKALWRDFLDLKKSKRYTTSVYETDSEGTGAQELSLDQLIGYFDTPEGILLKKERMKVILAEFADDPKAQEILQLQLDPTGYAAFTNQDLAVLLDISVDDVENRKKRVRTRLLRILHGKGETARA